MPGRSRRHVETIEFEPSGAGAVVERMEELASAGDGWINLMPGVPDEEVPDPPRGIFSAIFGTAQAPVSMGTWMPAAAGRRSAREETVGFMHPRGRDAVGQLASAGVTLPGGWRVSQDHIRRGLIVHPPSGAPHDEVLSWLVRAGAALSMVPLTGRWQARVYAPRPRSTTS